MNIIGGKYFILKLRFTENHSKSDASESSKVVYHFLQNELHEGNVMLVKVNKMYNL